MKKIVWIVIAALALTSCTSSTPPSPQIADSPSATPDHPKAPPSATPSSPWELKKEMPSARSEMAAVELNGLIYVVGGYGPVRGGSANGYDSVTTFEAYDPHSDQWVSLAPAPEPRDHSMMTAYDGHIYVFGGYFGDWTIQKNAWMYDPASDSWAVLNEMPASRTSGAAVTLGDSIYLIGGITSKVGDIPPTWRYDPIKDTWTAVASLQQPREHVNAVVMDGLIYALAGRWVGTLNSVEIYDPFKNEWTPGISMNDKRGGFGATVLNGKIYVAGGEIIENLRTVKSVEVFDPTAQTWSYLPDLPSGLHGVPMIGFENTLYVIGGSGRAADMINWGRVFSYQP